MLRHSFRISGNTVNQPSLFCMEPWTFESLLHKEASFAQNRFVKSCSESRVI
jgi:hypothetical protein